MKTVLCSFALCFCIAGSEAAILLRDSFSYADGVLTNVSGGLWRHAAGGLDQVDVQDGRVELSRSETEDVDTALAQSYASSSGGIIFTRFRVRMLTLPAGANGNYFAHLDGGGARARVFAVTNGAAQGQFRLGISAGASTASATWSTDLSPGQDYVVVTRFVVSNATATLWIDANVPEDPHVDSADAASAVTINRFTWRQDSGMGTLHVDDLVVATSFEEALFGNETPSLSAIADQQLVAGAATTIPFTVGDAETSADALEVFGEVSPPGASELAFGGAGSNRNVTITVPPAAAAPIAVRIMVSDGTTTNSRAFTVNPLAPLLFAEEFAYPDGPLVREGVSWIHHSGTVTGQVVVADGQALLSGALTEDVSVALPGGPFGTNSGVRLYVSLLLRFRQLPGSSGDYFAHFNSTGARGRLFANTANAAPGTFRLGIANAAGTMSEQLPVDLGTNAAHRVIVRYDPASARTRLWVNAGSESEFGVEASDAASPTAIQAFALREDPAIGLIAVDGVRIGLTFDSVVDGALPRLRIEPIAGAVRIAWPAAAQGFALEFTDDLGGDAWQPAGPSFVEGADNVITNSGAPHRFFRLAR